MTPQQVDPKKIVWQFWQSREGYHYNDDYMCMFDVFGYSIYKKFKRKDGTRGVDKMRPLHTYKSNAGNTVEDYQHGIAEAWNQYCDLLKELKIA